MARVEDYAIKAKQLGFPAMTISDHGTLSGLPEFYHACRKEGVEPVLAEEFYFIKKIDRTKKTKRPEYQHVVLVAKGEAGYRTLVDLSTEAHRNFYYKPVLDRDSFSALGKDAKNLVVISGCLAGPLSKAAQVGRDALWEELQWWTSIFPHYYVEIQEHGISIDRQVNNSLLWAADKANLPIVITSDPHFTHEHEHDVHDALLAIQTGSAINAENRFRFDGTGYWLKSSAEMRATYRQYPGVWEAGARSSLEIAEMCAAKIPEWETRSWQIPEIPGIDDPMKTLMVRSIKEARRRKLTKRYADRLRHEFEVIEKMGVAPFLLIAADIVSWAKSQGILVGPGRGSSAGSLVCYLLGVTRVDPVKYSLRFDRFLNPERPRMPDIDIDFSSERRDEIFEYIYRTYGEDCCMNVCTHTSMKVKRAFRSLAAAHGIPYAKANEISKDLPDDDDEAEDYIPETILKKYPDLAGQLHLLTGLKCGFGAHPAGVVIAPKSYDLKHRIPQMWLPTPKRWVSQYDMESLEEIGLLKQDILGIKTLDIIEQCIDMTGEQIDPNQWDPGHMPWDDDVWRMLQEGRVAGIFQFKGPSNKRGAQQVGVQSFDDLATVLALYRKGPMLSGATDTYLKNRKSGQIEYLHPSLEPILAPRHGAIVYQEDIMAIGEEIAGFGPGPNDDLLRATAKKKADLMASVEPGFLEGCMERGLSEQAAHTLWEQVRESAHYLFNMEHAYSYARLAYETAVLKVRFPLEFYAALLRYSVDDKRLKKYERTDCLREMARSGIKIKRPDVNRSGLYSTPEGTSSVRLGLTDIKGVGETIAKRIIKGREDVGHYRNSAQIKDIVNNTKTFALLQRAGAMKSMKVDPDPTSDEELLGWQFSDPLADIRDKIAPHHNPPTMYCGVITRSQQAKTKKGDTYCTWTLRWDQLNEWKVRIWSSAKALHSVPVGSIVRVKGRYDEEFGSIGIANKDSVRIIRRHLGAR